MDDLARLSFKKETLLFLVIACCYPDLLSLFRSNKLVGLHVFFISYVPRTEKIIATRENPKQRQCGKTPGLLSNENVHAMQINS